jgi:predicted P-loop ATPase
VHVGEIDEVGIHETRDQLWAEAVVAFEKGEKWWLDRAEADEVADASAAVLEVPAITESVAKWWTTKKDKTKPFTVGDVAVDLGFMQRELTQSLKTQIGQALRSLKFSNFRGTRDGVQQRLWHKGPHLISNDFPGTNDNVGQPKGEVSDEAGSSR